MSMRRYQVLASNALLTLGCVAYVAMLGACVTRYGVVGLIWANCANMAARVALAAATLARARKLPPLRQALPPARVWACAVCVLHSDRSHVLSSSQQHIHRLFSTFCTVCAPT